MLTIKDQNELETLLTSNGIDISHWGKGAAKHARDLWNEIVAGDSRIYGDPLRRVVQVVKVVIRQGDQILVEAEQELTDGRRRRRRRQPPADKMKPGESVVSAAVRCLEEELRLKGPAIQVLAHTHREEKTMGDSPSFPGLTSFYTYHYIDAKVADLPRAGFWVDNRGGATDPVKRHYWIWVPAASIDIPDLI